MATTALSVDGTRCILIKAGSGSGVVGHATASALGAYVNTLTQTGDIDNPAISTSGTSTTIKGGLAGKGANISGFGKVFNAVWNDYADFIPLKNFKGETGRCYVVREDGTIEKSSKYCQKGTLGVHSDTFAYCPGGLNPEKDLNSQGLILGVAGFVLAYTDKVYKSGTPLCAGEDGCLVKMSKKDQLLHPERLVGIFLKEETSKTVYGGQVLVLGRHWVKLR